MEIQEEDKAKGRANEIAILKAEEATRVIREAAVNGASQKELEKIANCIDKINIESKIKVNKYQKIKGLVNGTTFYV